MKCFTIAAALAGLYAGVASAADKTQTSALQAPSSPPVPKAPTVQGCYSSAEGLKAMDLSNPSENSSGKCIKDTCFAQGYNTGATQGFLCYCGNVFPPASALVEDKQCSQPCPAYPFEACGGGKAFSVYTTGNQLTGIDNAPDPVSSSSTTAASKPTQTASQPASSETSGAAQKPDTDNGGGGSTAAIAAGVVVGVVALAAIAGGIWFFMRRRRNREIEEEHRRNAAVNAFIHGNKPGSSGGVSMTDSRMDPVMAQRRMSDGSIADNQDYSRRILRVTNA